MEKVTMVLIGAGNRGMDSYAPYALRCPHELKFVAVVEPDPEKRCRFGDIHNVAEEMRFEKWESLFARDKLADAMLICTPDREHYEPAIKALVKGYHLLLEKPMATDPKECITLGNYAKEYERIFAICHVLRYSQFFTSLKLMIDEGAIGKLISIQHNENVGYWHQAHSYVRGTWRNSSQTSPMILAKSCHDMDVMLWLAGADCKSISSFGKLTHFTLNNAPEGATDRCTDGCPHDKVCPYYAPKLYLTENTEWPTSVISFDKSMESRLDALKNGPYGRCVYKCDNNVVDHQIASIEFENEVTAVFTMCAFTNDCSRTLKLMGTKGEIRANMEKNEIEITQFANGKRTVISLKEDNGRNNHGGGDFGIIRDFTRLVRQRKGGKLSTSAEDSVQAHLMAFAAEESRLTGKTINLKEYMESL